MTRLYTLFLFTLLILVNQSIAESDIFTSFDNRYQEITNEPVQKNVQIPTSNGIAVLDLKLALLLHPAMKDYNFTIHSFIKPIPKNLNVPINFYLKNRIKESSEMVLKSKKTYKDLRLKQLEVQQKISSLIYNKSSNIRKIMSSNRGDTESQLEKFRSDYQKKLKRYQLQKLSITKDIVNTFDTSYGIHYMTRTDRDRLLKKIEKEVLLAAKKVLNSQNLSVLLNGNYLEDVAPQTISKLAWVDKNFTGVNALSFYFQRQHQVIDDEIQSYSEQIGADLFDPYYKNLNKIPAIFGKNYNDQFILLGGKNITKATLQVLYQKYNKLNLIKDILSFVQKIKENQHE
ncbi:MAG: hypothetical protein KC646_01060 [Candidatus Cloacimonetes bacterium]|nr:hypothetical protein [Candidatus Cloacimonadota bacterium]